VEYDPERHESISDLVAAADEQMYRDKRAGR
jgi:GGDEF domain-containing protein